MPKAVSTWEKSMFLLDDILLSPARGLMFVMREIKKAVDAERAADRRRIMAALTSLHRALDDGSISEAEFETREAELLERLDKMGDGTPENAA